MFKGEAFFFWATSESCGSMQIDAPEKTDPGNISLLPEANVVNNNDLP